MIPRNAGTFVEQNFVNGLVTEATGMNFPENACTSASDVIFKETGEVSRRFGYNYEHLFQLNSITRSSSAVVEYLWKAAGGDGTIDFVVQQIGLTLRFYRVSATTGLSDGIHATTFALTTFDVAGAPATNTEPCSFSSGKGFLFVTHKYCEPFYITYTVATDALTATSITLKIRDFEGVDDSLGTRERPASMTATHRYNLYNQGWFKKVVEQGGTIDFPIQSWDDFFPVANFPSNADIWWLYKDSNGWLTPSIGANIHVVGQALAPRGYFILDAFNQDRTATVTALNDESNTVPTITAVTSSYFRPSCTAFFAGRVWYSGVNFSGFSQNIYYSQIVERDSQLGLCHQNNDPTNEDLSDLLDTDGGIIRILDIGTIHKLFPTQKALLVFATNGVWSISGSETIGFKATDYTIKKISSVGVVTGLSFVDVLGSPLFWNEDGIWTVNYDQGDFTVVSVSDKKIKSFFKDIPAESKKWVKGAYNSVDRLVQWVYRSTSPSTVDARYTYDRILTLNITTGAFYPWTINSATKTVNGIITCLGVTSAGVDSNPFRYFVTKNISGTTYDSTFAVSGTTYLDWVADSENFDYSATSLFISGYRVHAEGNKEFQSNYVTFVCSDETNSSAFAQGVWDYSNSISSKKWSTAQQIYNSTPSNRDYRIRRLKVRGWGKSLQFRVTAVTDKPFNVVGWSVFETGNPLP